MLPEYVEPARGGGPGRGGAGGDGRGRGGNWRSRAASRFSPC